MGTKLKILGFSVAIFLMGCNSNSSSTVLTASDDIKRFTGVVNSSSVKGAEVAALPIGKHGQFALDENSGLQVKISKSDDKGRFGFTIDAQNVGPYVLSATAPEFTEETKAEQSAKASCQLIAGCLVNAVRVPFGEFYTLEANSQWSAAVQFVSKGQFIVINAITEMASALGYTIYIGDGIETDLDQTNTPAASYYSNYGISKGNSQTAALFGLGDIVSVEPANLSYLHNLDISASTSIEESIRYGALLAAWQQLELDFNKDLVEGESTFQKEVVSQFLDNKGQLYQAEALDNQVLSMKQWYQVARDNLVAVRDYHVSLSRSLPGEVNLVIARFNREIEQFSDAVLTTAEPVIFQDYAEDYSDAVAKTKAMVNYLSNLQNNFATEEYRESIKVSSDLVTAETRRLSPKLDRIFHKILSVYQYYISCTHGACDTLSEWHSVDASAGNTFDESTNTLTISKPEGASLVVSQGLVFDEQNPEGSTSANTHDLFLSGVLEFDGLKIKLSDFDSENSASIKSSIRFSYPVALEQLPLIPEKVVGGMGVSINESLVPDYIELAMPNFKLYEPSQEGLVNELVVYGALTALMIANTDAGDALKDEQAKLGKRYNLANVRGSLTVSGQDKGSVDSEAELRDQALFYIEASASESFVSGQDFTAYFPDQVYPSFEAFFKPREGFEVGQTSPFPLVVSRKGIMQFPMLDGEGVASETENILVPYIEFDYEVGGLERYLAYPKIEGEDEYWGLICTAIPTDEDALIAAGDEYVIPVLDDDNNPVLDAEGNPLQRALLTCPFRDRYEGEATTDDFVNQVYAKNKNLLNLREYNGHGAYRIDYPLTNDVLDPFPNTETSHTGTLEIPIVLGVDSMRLQFKPKLVNQAGSEYLQESIVDISLVWRTHNLIDVNALLAFDAEQVVNNPNGTGLPYLAVGNDSESYSVAYRTDADGNEFGEYVMAWAGVRFVDGEIDGTKVMERTLDEDLKEGVFAGVGSNVFYGGSKGISEKKCGMFALKDIPVAGEKCDAIAYLTFRGLVTGSLREERDGVYVIRYIDDSWQILGSR